MFLFLMLLSLNSSLVKDTSFLERQMSFSRVDAALDRNIDRVDKQCEKTGTDKFDEIYIRAFKAEMLFEIWKKTDNGYVLYDTFPICYTSGVLGPKRKQGDLQVPEGFYEIKVFNPASTYHLSLGLNYPNKRDEIVNKPPRGGDIYIHGKCMSAGCLSMEDPPIEEIYVVAMLAKAAGQETIPVHIFPFKMTEERMKEYALPINNSLLEFWRSIQPAYTIFEKSKRLPNVHIDNGGKYIVTH